MRKTRLGNRRRFYDGDREENPMDGVANLVDAMLVLACGLMMAIISFYNVDIGSSSKTEEIQQQDMKEVDNYGIIDDKGQVSGGFESRGKVYEDKKTGKLYVITEEEDSDSDAADSGAEGEN